MIPLPNEAGQLARLAKLMGDGGVDIRSIGGEQEAGRDHGVVRLVVDHYDLALQLLRSAGYAPVTEDALLIRAKDEPGSLARIAVRFSEAGLNLKSIHILHRRNGESIVSLVTENNIVAREIVSDILIDPE